MTAYSTDTSDHAPCAFSPPPNASSRGVTTFRHSTPDIVQIRFMTLIVPLSWESSDINGRSAVNAILYKVNDTAAVKV